MSKLLVGLVLTVGLVGLGIAPLWAQPQGGPGRGPGPGGAGGPGPDGPTGMMNPRMMRMPDEFDRTIGALGMLNLQPDFNLTGEQKQKLQQIREQVKQAEEKWRQEHAEELRELAEDAREAFQSGEGRDQLRDLMERRREIMQTAPTNEDAVKQVKELLSAEQRQALEARLAEREAERPLLERMRQRLDQPPAAGRRGRADPRGNGGANDNAGE